MDIKKIQQILGQLAEAVDRHLSTTSRDIVGHLYVDKRVKR